MGKYLSQFDQINSPADGDWMLVETASGIYKKVPFSVVNTIAAQLSNVIAGTATEVSASEIIDARTLASGVAYTTLGDAVRSLYAAQNAITTNTYTTFDDVPAVVGDGSVTVVKKGGWCLVHGSVTLPATVSDMTYILNSTKVPVPQHGVGVYTTAAYWAGSFVRNMRVGVSAGGGLRIQYGGAGTYTFAIAYPIA